jgi:hypothetical protein
VVYLYLDRLQNWLKGEKRVKEPEPLMQAAE